MADSDTPTPMTDADIVPPPATTEFVPAAPLKDEAVTFEPAEPAPAPETKIAAATQTIKEGSANLRGQATDKVLTLADDGKARAVGALEQFSTMLTDAAGTVDEKLGEQYGQYARMAAERVEGFRTTLDNKSVDELLDDARTIVRKSPAAAVGVAAAVGFVVARVLTAGYDQRGA